MSQIQYEMKSPVGPLYLVANDTGLQGIFFDKQSLSLKRTLQLGTASDKILIKTIAQLEEYFAGKRKQFDINLSFSGTPFQQHVWHQLTKIPFGQTVSYKDIAKRIKNPKAVRAVGTANGKNPFCIIVPCHRVIAADGTIGGYGGGIANKRKLLELEQNKSIL